MLENFLRHHERSFLRFNRRFCERVVIKIGTAKLHRIEPHNTSFPEKLTFMKNIFVFVTNMKSRGMGEKLGYTELAKADCYTFEMNGKKPFGLIEEAERYQYLMWKSLL